MDYSNNSDQDNPATDNVSAENSSNVSAPAHPLRRKSDRGPETNHAEVMRNPEIDQIRDRLQRSSRDHMPPRRGHRRRASDNPRVSVVVPARNEAKNLPIMFQNIPQDVFEIVVVDGNSTDNTIEVAKSLRKNVRVIGQERPGKGNALICGFKACRGDVIVMIDADCSMDAAEIPLYVEALVDGAEFVKGSRYMEGGGSEDITRIRSAGNNALRVAVNTIYGTEYTDLCYGFSGFWAWTLPHMELDCDGFEIETLMNIRAHTAGLRVAEVPSMEYNRLHGASNLNAIRDGLRILNVIAREKFRKTADIAPGNFSRRRSDRSAAFANAE
jgi:glycosyltransferase involved in cell wall biosynthesis